jgi:acetyl esterase/lipase
MKSLIKASLFLFFAGSFASCQKSPNDTEPIVEAKTILNVSYGTSPEHKMDVYLPANRTATTPVAILLHGGGFIAGDKSEFSMQSQMLAAKGYAVLNMNYRLVDTSGLFKIPLVHKASAITINQQIADIKTAMSFAAGMAGEWIMNTNKWGICGHSAGATLALLAAYNYGSANEEQRLKAVANWAGATTLSFTDEAEFNLQDPRLKEIYFRITGYEPINANKLAYMAVSPDWQAFNGKGIPTLNLRPEFNAVFGSDPGPALYQSFTTTLTNKGVPNKWIELKGADHGFGQPGNWQVVVNETAAWFDKYLQ